MALFASVHSDPLLIFLAQLALTLVLTRLLSKAFSHLQQPLVIGEILAGILMGPSVLGRIPGFSNAVFPTGVSLGLGQPPTYDSTVTFGVVADVGVILFMFLLGCELDHHRLNAEWRTALPIALSAILVPFGVGAANGLWLEAINAEGQPAGWVPPPHRSFMLFTGTSMSFTAFPVLASMLANMRLLATPLGMQALSCAAIDDVAGWCCLAVVSSFAGSASPLAGLWTTLGACAFIAFMLLAARPALRWVHRQASRRGAANSPYLETALFVFLIASAYLTQALGIHAFFGAFLAGIIVPKDDGFAQHLAGRMELVVTDVLLPLFFAASGLKTNIATINTWRGWGVVLALICIATFAKVTPALLVGKAVLRGRSWRFCLSLGVMMNTRGLVELIALNIGLTMGILTTRTFSMFVLMAIATTWMTGPLLSLLYRNHKHDLYDDDVQGGTHTMQVSSTEAATGQAEGGPPPAAVAGSQQQEGRPTSQLSAAASSLDVGLLGPPQRSASVTFIYTARRQHVCSSPSCSGGGAAGAGAAAANQGSGGLPGDAHHQQQPPSAAFPGGDTPHSAQAPLAGKDVDV